MMRTSEHTHYILAETTPNGVALHYDVGELHGEEEYRVLHEAQNSGHYCMPFLIARSAASRYYPQEMRLLVGRERLAASERKTGA